MYNARNSSCQSLLDTTGRRLVEAVTGDDFGPLGFLPILLPLQIPYIFPGCNQLGVVLDNIRDDIMKEMVLSKLLGVDDDMPGTNPIFNNSTSN